MSFVEVSSLQVATTCVLSATEKDLGFLRIGSLNVRVKRTTEAFSNFLGVGPGTQRQPSHPQQRYRNTIQHGQASRHRTNATLAEETEPDGSAAEAGGKALRSDHLKAWNSVDDIPVVSLMREGVFVVETEEVVSSFFRTRCHHQSFRERRREIGRRGARRMRRSATACRRLPVSSTGRWTRMGTPFPTTGRRRISTRTIPILDSIPAGAIGDLLPCAQLTSNLTVYMCYCVYSWAAVI